MIDATAEDVRFALATGVVVGALLGALLTLCLRKTRKPPMASRTSSFFTDRATRPNWQQQARGR